MEPKPASPSVRHTTVIALDDLLPIVSGLRLTAFINTSNTAILWCCSSLSCHLLSGSRECLSAFTRGNVWLCGRVYVQRMQVFCDHSKSVHLSAFKPEPRAEAHNSVNRVEGNREAALAVEDCSERFVKTPDGGLDGWGSIYCLLQRCPLFCLVFSFSPRFKWLWLLFYGVHHMAIL